MSGFHNFGMMMVKLVQWKSRNKRPSTSSIESGGIPDLTTQVVEDHAAASSKEVSVQRGQQVEVIDPSPPGFPDWCLVRTLPPDGADSAQGLVPSAVLRPVSFLTAGRNSIDLDDTFGSAEGTSSPVSKRRSSFKKWLTTPVRKLSHGKIEKTGGMLLDPQRGLQRGPGKQGLGPLGGMHQAFSQGMIVLSLCPVVLNFIIFSVFRMRFVIKCESKLIKRKFVVQSPRVPIKDRKGYEFFPSSSSRKKRLG
ncbi:kalirin-like isoform x8 [Plakobranchus ocellatus]|uniref:Kalirin-like isoform x8 n=1 Tax=Plakobranchus ocellatus TaxID=259542 RepID=A0AAV4A1D1_9GAST|nr:kalirin-like isoform x8 [Plakobranchus ocellatus]